MFVGATPGASQRLGPGSTSGVILRCVIRWVSGGHGRRARTRPGTAAECSRLAFGGSTDPRPRGPSGGPAWAEVPPVTQISTPMLDSARAGRRGRHRPGGLQQEGPSGSADPRARWGRLSRLADLDGPVDGRSPRRDRRQLRQAPVGAGTRRPPPVPDPDPPRAGPRLARGDRERDRAPRRRSAGLRLRRGADRRLPARRDRPLRRAAVGALLDDRRPPRDLHPGEQRHRHAQRHLRHPRSLAGDAPGQARHDGRVRDARTSTSRRAT